jgi:hypothetical protein
MRRCVPFVMAFLTLSLAGCGGNSSEKLAQNTLAGMQEITAALEKGDKNAVLAAAKKMQALTQQAKDLKLSDEETKRVTEKYKTQFEEQSKKLMQAMMKASTEGKLKPEDMQEISSAMQPGK